jgi:hypothetical protein
MWVKVCSLVMALITPVSMFAADTGAMLYPQGNVTVNGVQLDRSQAIFNGDRVHTAANGAVTITATGSSVLLAGDTSLLYGSQAVQFDSGAATIKTTKGLKTHFMNVRIEPAPNARYDIAARNGEVAIAALEGTLRLFDGYTTRVVKPGNALVAKIGPLPDPPQTTERRRRGGAGAAPAAGVGVTLSSGTLKAIAIGTGVAGAIAVLLLTRRPKPAPASSSGTGP